MVAMKRDRTAKAGITGDPSLSCGTFSSGEKKVPSSYYVGLIKPLGKGFLLVRWTADPVPFWKMKSSPCGYIC